MNIHSEIKASFKEVLNQLTAKRDPKQTEDIYFTPNFYTRAKEYGLSEDDAEDVFHHGEPGTKPNQLIRKYPGYEIGIYFFFNNQGKPVISTIWKK